MIQAHNCGYFLAAILSYKVFVILGGTILLVFGLYYLLYYKPKTRFTNLGTILLFLGGAGNLIERIVNQGCVLDYIQFFNLFAFNVYDVMVDLGLIMFIVSIVRNKDDEQT